MSGKGGRRFRPATTPQGRENQLISLAADLAEKQLRDGTASSQVITHFLKMASGREELEREKMQRENLLLSAKVAELDSRKNSEELYAKALEAMRKYSGQDDGDYDQG